MIISKCYSKILSQHFMTKEKPLEKEFARGILRFIQSNNS